MRLMPYKYSIQSAKMYVPPCKNMCVGVHVCGLHCEIVNDSSSLVPRTLGGHKAIHGSL